MTQKYNNQIYNLYEKEVEKNKKLSQKYEKLRWEVEELRYENKQLKSKLDNMDSIIENAVNKAQTADIVKNNDLVVITAGVPLGISGTTNMLKVQVVGSKY